MARKSRQNNIPDCPCQSGLPFSQCCQPFLDAEQPMLPETAEQLMRSRYTAYVLKNSDYLLNTWHPEHRPASLNLDNKNQWIGLNILKTISGGKDDLDGQVHFVARFKINGKAHKLQENSIFKKIDGHWLYVTGDIS